MSNTLIKETQAAIERLMRWCAAKNKEPCLPLDERAFVMDIEMVYTEAAKHMQPSEHEQILERQLHKALHLLVTTIERYAPPPVVEKLTATLVELAAGREPEA